MDLETFDVRTSEDLVEMVRQFRRQLLARLALVEQTHVPIPAAHYQIEVTETITAAVGNVPGTGKVNIERFDTGTETMETLFEDLDAKQLGGEEIEVGRRVIAHIDPWGDIWVCNETTKLPARVRFKATGSMTDRQVDATVQRVVGDTVAEVGDSVVIADPMNHRPGMLAGAVGWANWYAGDSPVPARWELEHATATIEFMRAELVDCLKVTDTTGIKVRFTNVEWLKSVWPNVDMPVPAEAVDKGGGVFEITCRCPGYLHAIEGSLCRIRRVEYSAATSEPDNETVPTSTSSIVHWEIEWVEQPIAEIVEGDFDFTGSNFTTDNEVYDKGYKQTGDCAPPIELDINPPCNIVGTFKALYHPNIHKYKVWSTESALLGPAQKRTVLGSPPIGPKEPSCNVELTKYDIYGFCPTAPEDVQVPLYNNVETINTVVTTNNADGTSSLCILPVTVQVCDTNGGYGYGDGSCTTVFPPLCDDQELCSGSTATWVWDGSQWNQTTACMDSDCISYPPAFAPLPGQPTTMTLPCYTKPGTGA